MTEHVRPWVKALQEDLDVYRAKLREFRLPRRDREIYRLHIRRLSVAIDALVLGACFYAASLRAREQSRTP